MPVAGLSEGDRILLRDRPWRVRKVTGAGERHRIVEVEALDGDHPAELSVVVPPEEITPLPGEAIQFDLRGLDSFASWSRAHLILAATLVRETGLLTGARFGRVAIEAYQLAPALRLLAKPRPSLLIADDVGLGKTIEAGLAILELMARRRGSRILIVTPPGLMDQWRQELRDKFGLEFTLIDNASGLARVQTDLPAGTNPWDVLPRVITSLDYLKKETVRGRALRKRWDLVIVDEAHALAESGTPENPYRTQRTRLGLALREAARGLILLTATPHNGYAHSFRSLIELVEPTHAAFSGSPKDVARRIETASIRRMKAQITRRLPDGRQEPVFPRRSVCGIPVTLASKREKELLHKVASYCSRTARAAASSDEAELIGFAMQIVKKRALSSRAALARTLEHRLDALKSEEARAEPPDRAELRDLQADLPLVEAAAERTARRILRSAIPKEERRRRSEIKALNAIRRLLKRLPSTDPKVEALLAELRRVFAEDPTEKVIVFTEYRDTLEAIQASLDGDPEFADRYVILRGGLTRRQRLARQEAFEKPEIRVLLATDAASEGLNLQRRCRRVIHFELPWNPNRLEQRNGRVDRYGQTREPIIRYLYYPDSPEESVLDQLIAKIEQMAKDRVSTPDVLGLVAGERRLADGLTKLDPEADDVDTRKDDLVRLFEDRTAEFVQNVRPLLAVGGDAAAEQERILRLLDTAEPLLPDDTRLEEIALGILGHDAVRAVSSREGILRIEVPPAYRGPGVAPVYPAATFRRSIAVRYRPQEVEYLTPQHPLVLALAADARRRLLQVYAGVRGIRPRRLAARTVPAGEPPSVVFTFLGTIQGGGGLLEEEILAVRVDPQGHLLGDPQANLRYVSEEKTTGDVPRACLERLFAAFFERMRQVAEDEAKRLAEERARQLRRRRGEQAALLRQELERDLADRLREIDDEERRARGLIEETGQVRLFAQETGRGGFQARREAAKAAAENRREEIEAFEQVDTPAPPRPLGALFLVPEGTVP
ncbi:helicase-related protein [Desulfosoma caldarium]|uniref:SNF2 domain-containing protein n=1 Tax=Desulfosoma caldarium TaxID=610254 RepID=A0A3N1VJD3_9BACT|nr:helicase-related protein [Desulfosoma caldarium]ROR02914.1 SNF2 domain-containing protein [Desulfosoma caldarium]